MGGRRGRKRRRRQGPAKGAAGPTASRANFLQGRRVPETGAYRGRGPLPGNCLPAQRNPELPTQGQHLTARAGLWGWIQLNDNPARGARRGEEDNRCLRQSRPLRPHSLEGDKAVQK